MERPPGIHVRTKVVAGLAITFLAIRAIVGFSMRDFPIDPTPILYVIIWTILIPLWAALLLGIKVAWYPLAAYYAYESIQYIRGMLGSRYVGGVGAADEIGDLVMVVIMGSAMVVPLITLILDPPWKWKKIHKDRNAVKEPGG